MKLRSIWKKVPGVLLLLIIVFLSASVNFSCKKNTAANNNNNNNNNNNQNSGEGVFVGNTASNFTENDQSGSAFSLDSLKGKVILLNFSAGWCGPCRNEASHLMEIYNTYKERGLEIVQCIFEDNDGASADLDFIKAWIKEYGISYRVVNDPNFSTVNTFQLSAIPLNLVIGRDFVIIYRMEGFEKEKVIKKIEDAL